MVKLKRPLLSTAASGPLSGILDYSTRRRGAIAGAHRVPAQPRTQPQRATRLWMTWLTKQWKTFTAEEQASWNSAYPFTDLSPYHAYLRHNTSRLNNLPGDLSPPNQMHAWPTKAYPAAETGDYGTFRNWSVTPGPGYLEWKRDNNLIRQQWSMFLFHITAENPGASIRNLVSAETSDQPTTYITRITNLPPGYCLLKLAIITTTGNTRGYWSGIDGVVL